MPALAKTYRTELFVIPSEGSHVLYEDWYDDEGYPWLGVGGIIIDPQQVTQLSEELGIEEDIVLRAILAHEYGHVFAFYKNQDNSDEELAWKFGEDIFYHGPPDPFKKVRAYALASYGLV
jgi:hypothetical protein